MAGFSGAFSPDGNRLDNIMGSVGEIPNINWTDRIANPINSLGSNWTTPNYGLSGSQQGGFPNPISALSNIGKSVGTGLGTLANYGKTGLGNLGNMASWGKAGLGNIGQDILGTAGKYKDTIGAIGDLWGAYSTNKFNKDYMKQVTAQNAFNRGATQVGIIDALEGKYRKQYARENPSSTGDIAALNAKARAGALDTMSKYGIA